MSMTMNTTDALDLGIAHYRDTGCQASPSCLACPLPRCLEDVADATVVPGQHGMQARRVRWLQEIRQMQGPPRRLARLVEERYKVSRRTAHRLIAEAAVSA